MEIIKKVTQGGNSPKVLHFLNKKTEHYISPIIEKLSDQVDIRLVRTFCGLFVSILTFRNRSQGLLLSELGSYILDPEHAPAGTKRISNLLLSPKWNASLISDFLFEKARDRANQMISICQRPLFHWDDSRLEKSESLYLEGLCSVFSSKAQRLSRIRPGFYTKGKIVHLPGFHWAGVVLSSLTQHASVVEMKIWTTRGKFKDWGCNILWNGLKRIEQELDSQVIHVFDRGYAKLQTLEYLYRFHQDFVIRWVKTHCLYFQKGFLPIFQISRRLKNKSVRFLYDPEANCYRKVFITWIKVTHPVKPKKVLTLVVVRTKKNNSPMYLLTSLEINTKKQAWQCFHIYMDRWKVEEAFRFEKCELGIESVRLWFWENREKLLLITVLVYDFLLQTLQNWNMWARMFMQQWAHRTGNRCCEVTTPIYRFRLAISNLLNSWFGFLNMSQFVNSG